MSEWSIEEMCEGLRSFSGTDTRERFYEAIAAKLESQSTENRELRDTIVKAYQRLGFTNHKNETMRILGDMIRKVKDSDQVGESPND